MSPEIRPKSFGTFEKQAPGSDSRSDRISDRTGVFAFGAELLFLGKAVLTMTQVDRIFFFRAACASNKKNSFSCITSHKIHHHAEF